MPFKIKVIKFISSLLLAVFFIQNTTAQKIKIDAVGVVVGKNIVLDSDIEKFKLELENNSEGKIKISDCEMLEQLMLQKLLAHHAVVDSIVVSDAEVNSQVERNIQFFSQEYGSVEKVVEAYGFNDIEDLKTELFGIEKENSLIQKEQGQITENIDVTPEEIRIYFNGLKEKGELPEFPAEIQIAQLVLNAEASPEEIDRILKKLNQLKKEIEEGSSFKMKAIINSNDPGVTENGGRYSIDKNSQFIKEFKETAFSLDVNQVSEPFKSQFGYHIIQLHEIRGEIRIASHILLQPEIPQEKLEKTKELLVKIVAQIKSGEVTFEEAVRRYSQDTDTRNNGGLIVNPYSGESTFDLTRMDPALYARVNNLQKNEMSNIFYDEDRSGKKMYKVMIMKDRTNTHVADMVDDYVKVQNLALQKKKQETIAKWSKEKIGDTYIKISSEYQKCNFDKNWTKEISN
ncbi:peptidylprolyl isomerase [Flavobacteriaceae bacterium]|nr:peptidylprolyl isomerase [Flavobacteriaceae bacterium]MDC0331006.1 peptidylprolyl isomerase [Flavobacteriaceae bacterium]